MRKRLLSTVLAVPVLMHQVTAQNREITGRVTDAATGQGLPGVTVLVKGTTVGTSTNADGSFTLSAPASATTLVFSSVGYNGVERPIGSDATVNVALGASTRNLEEVVVTGLATSVKRSNLANAITTISAKELVGSTRPVTVDAALSGKVVGANIAQTSGAPGGGISVQLRGISTINGSSQPLYIIDGVYAVNQEVGNGAGSAAFSSASSGVGRTTQDNGINRLSDLNPNDIESIEILKGPSAAAIYGTRANAGVIIIKTKRGAAGQTRISFSQDVGFAKAWRLLGQEDWTPEKIDNFYTPGTARNTAERAALAAARDAGNIVDYEKEVFGNTAFLRNTGVSLSGGNERTKFFVSGFTTNEEGIVKRTGFNRNSIRANIDQKIGQRIDIGVSSNYINSENRRGFTGNDNRGVALGYTLAYTPNYAQLFPNDLGVFPDNPYAGDNPLAIVERAINEEETNRFVQTATATVRIIDKEQSSLRFAAQGGIDFSNSTALLALPPDLQSQRDLPLPGAARLAKNEFFNSNLQGFLIYDWRLGEKINLTSQIGTVRLSQRSNLSYNQGQNLTPGSPYTPNRGAIITQETLITEEADVGFVAQQEANFNDQIIATAGIRFDKSNRNGDPNKYYAFPKASLAVNVAKFGFWTLEPVNLVKLRAAYGETGGPAFFNALYSPLNAISTGGRPGLLPSTLLGNPDIKPETASEFETGIDLGFLENRVVLEASYYNKEVFDLVNTYVLAPAVGVTSLRAYNIGDLRNRGIELALNVTPVRRENVSWTTSTQFWFNRTKVTRLDQDPLVVPPFNTGLGFGNTFGRNLFIVGESPSRWYGSPVNFTLNNNFSGLTRYEEAQPKFQMSFLNSLTLFRSLELSFLVHWKKDGYNSNLSRLLQDEGGTTKDWSEPSGELANDGTPIPKGIYRQGLTAREFIQNAGYVRLREASVYYTLPSSIRTSMFKEFVKNIRVGVSGNNLITWTDYVGYDPEVSNFGATANFAQVDVASYPTTRRIFFHLNLDF
ncbi:SusC/RagA family TonB-linked outer membrane protein [Hymenobacter weizhouensis]|uniref:SusC/RagA family TonB-linked outer membrane protein n=1 Tax=Hymenobacter sp. YIM 151500-1 TaxID=2987689 RepID=UPI002225ECD3|nr:SusC/RagA family TonB-linked outer membrane protein [Hymenobacter sp. YIM 151500-1]UYZ63271.1 SusC/RagA family TonB-linked outer membrane protein [Hymenobacter sp. YIM 151500-1]